MLDSTADVLLHPVRIRIVVALVGRELTTQQIATAIPDVPQATLYRHINRLATAGILKIVEERPVRGTVEKVYTTVPHATSLAEHVAEMQPTDWSRAFSAFTAFLGAQFEAYISQNDCQPVADGVGFRTYPLNLTDNEMAQFAAEIRATVAPRLAHAATPGRRRRQFSTVFIPDPLPPTELETQQ